MAPKNFALILAQPLFFPFFSTIPQFKVASQPAFQQMMRQLTERPPVSQVLAGGNTEMMGIWNTLRCKPFDQVSQVEIFYILRQLQNLLVAADRVRQEQEVRARELEEESRRAREEEIRALEQTRQSNSTSITGLPTSIQPDDPDVQAFQSLRATLYLRPNFNYYHYTYITAGRRTLLDDAHRKIMAMESNQYVRLHVAFEGEAGDDGGGLKREFFTTVSSEALRKEEGGGCMKYFEIFGDGSAFRVNPAADQLLVDEGDVSRNYYRFIGRFLALAILNKQNLPVNLSIPTYEARMGRDISLLNPSILYYLQQHEPEFLQSMLIILATERVENVFNFVFTTPLRIPLMPGGADIPVTDGNKAEYVKRMVCFECIGQAHEAITMIREGLSYLLPLASLAPFPARHLDFLLSGSPTISLADWKANTEYGTSYVQAYSEREGEELQMVRWFWEYLEASTDKGRSDFLLFATGSSRPPVTGFKDLIPRKFNITVSPSYGEYPRVTSRTCFNTIFIYICSKDQFWEKMDLAIAHAVGFGFR